MIKFGSVTYAAQISNRIIMTRSCNAIFNDNSLIIILEFAMMDIVFFYKTFIFF